MQVILAIIVAFAVSATSNCNWTCALSNKTLMLLLGTFRLRLIVLLDYNIRTHSIRYMLVLQEDHLDTLSQGSDDILVIEQTQRPLPDNAEKYNDGRKSPGGANLYISTRVVLSMFRVSVLEREKVYK